MKIKTWLLLTYLLLMLLPIGALYGLYVSINQYYEDKNFVHYFETRQQVASLKTELEHAHLYRDGATYDQIAALTSSSQMITLYNANGKVLYSSNPISNFSKFETKKATYENLYELHQTYQSFVYKEPVYDGDTVVGIYKITLPRTEWAEQVSNKTLLVGVMLTLFLIVLYGFAMYALHRRLNKPLQQLIVNMAAFAQGKPTTKIAASSDEIGQLVASFEQMQQQLIASQQLLADEQRQKQFMIASLSHDLKTPLTSIQAYAESLTKGHTTAAEQQEYAHIIYTKSNYMKQLVDDLMMFTLLQSPTYELQLVEVDGIEFFDMLLSDYEAVSREKGFNVSVTVDVCGTYNVHPKQLMRVLDNVVGNAWTYTPPNGTIRIAAFEQQPPTWYTGPLLPHDGCYIIVENSGDTLDAAACLAMFEPLNQLDHSRSQVGQRGAGLGLSIAKQIIDKHNGTIHAVSHNNQTAIIISLPRSDSYEKIIH